MKLTGAIVNPICKSYQKKYRKLIKSFSRRNIFLSTSKWYALRKNFFMANWISLFWFFVENQNSVKINKVINKQTFNLLDNDEFMQILASFFTKTEKIQNYDETKITNEKIYEIFQNEFQQILFFIENNKTILKEELINFLKKNTKLLIAFSIYDYCISEMKFIFEYPEDKKFIYEKNVALIERQINLLTMIQENIQKIDNFYDKNNAIILITTMRKKNNNYN